jgi:hypothetical protein
VDQTQEDVLGADVVVIEEARLLLRQYDDSSSPVCKPFEHSYTPVTSNSALCGGASTTIAVAGFKPGTAFSLP